MQASKQKYLSLQTKWSFSRNLSTILSQFAEYGRTRRDLARAEPIFVPFSFNYLDKSRACTCHTLQTGSWAIHEKRLPGNYSRNAFTLDTNGYGPNWSSCIKNWRKDGCTYPKKRHIYKSSNSQQKAIYWWRKSHTSGNHRQICETWDKLKPIPSKKEFEVSFYSWPWLFCGKQDLCKWKPDRKEQGTFENLFEMQKRSQL